MSSIKLHICKNLKSGDTITCGIGDETIHGEVYIAPKDLSVRLIDPIYGLQASVHMMLMQPASYVSCSELPLANERAISRIQALVIGLCQDYLLIKTHKEEIVRRLPEYRKAVDSYNIEKKVLLEEKNRVAINHRLNRINQAQYTNAIDDLWKREQKLKDCLDKDFSRIFGDLLSDCIHSDNLPEVIVSLN